MDTELREILTSLAVDLTEAESWDEVVEIAEKLWDIIDNYS